MSELRWKNHTPNLIKEILVNPQCAIFKIPLQLLQNQLGRVATRASQLNDPELNALMCEMSLYAIADPTQKKDYDPEKVKEIFALSVPDQEREETK